MAASKQIIAMLPLKKVVTHTVVKVCILEFSTRADLPSANPQQTEPAQGSVRDTSARKETPGRNALPPGRSPAPVRESCKPFANGSAPDNGSRNSHRGQPS